jgi:quinol---cytochrome c reductase iron-sulfur subunit
VARAKNWLVAALVLLAGRGRPSPRRDRPRIVARREPAARDELVTLALLALSSLAAVAFVIVYAVDAIRADTQLLGLALGLSLLFLAAALVLIGKRLVPDEELQEPYPPDRHPLEEELVVQIAGEGVDGITRRRLVRLGLLGAGGTLALAAITPALSLGPALRLGSLLRTPWRRGRRLVGEDGRPLRAVDIEEDAFYTAFPEGADREDAGSPVVVVRVPRAQLALPRDLVGFDADGIVAYSSICTHAGCAVSMYRVPTFPPTEPRPALVCPCHYSTFDPARGGSVLYGPAGRPLPMLPLRVDGRGYLRADGNFAAPVGPSWWGVRLKGPRP